MSTVFYVAVNGNDATALINDPTHPYTLAGILGTNCSSTATRYCECNSDPWNIQI